MDRKMNNVVSDELILALAREIEKDEAKTSILNPTRVQEMRRALSLLRCVKPGRGVSVTYQLHAPMHSMGCITIQGPEIEFDDHAAFTQAIGLASNADFYPLADGGVCIDLAFHGITKHIK